MERKWRGTERVRPQRNSVREIDRGFEDDNPIGLPGDAESKLVRNDSEADQVERLIFIRAHVHGTGHDAWIAIQVGAGGRERIQAGIDARGVGLHLQIAGGQVHEQWRVGDVADTVGRLRRRAGIIQDANPFLLFSGWIFRADLGPARPGNRKSCTWHPDPGPALSSGTQTG